MKKTVIHGLLLSLSLSSQGVYAADILPEKVTATLPEYHLPAISLPQVSETNTSTPTHASAFTAHPYIAGALGITAALSGMVIITGGITYITFNLIRPKETTLPPSDTTPTQPNQSTQEAEEQSFAQAVQSEPWKTEQEITAIAQGLETVLKNDLTGQITEEEIQTLQTKTQAEDGQLNTLDHALMRQVSIPADAELYMHADLHGDFGPIQAMLTYLESKNEFDPQTGILSGYAHVAFLGDYIDRGPNSLKNLWYLWQLKLHNPDRVFLIRGNHETATISQLGLIDIFNQLKAGNFDVKQSIPIHKKFLNAFALLPIVTFIDRKNSTNSRIALVHGGINPDNTDITEQFKGKSFVVVETETYQYLWSDLNNVDNDEKTTQQSYRGAGKILCKTDVKNWMQANNVAIIFHGHDQNERTYTDKNDKNSLLFKGGKWRGMGSRWEDHAIVLNVAPNTTAYNQRRYNEYPFYCDYGTFVCIKPKPADFAPAQPSSDPQFATNTFAQELITLPDCILEPIYFLPKNPTTIIPNDQVLDSRPQDTFSNNNNLVKQQPNQDSKD